MNDSGDGRNEGQGGSDKPDRPTGRKLAEWLTLGLSVALVLGVAIFLLYSALQDHPQFVPIEVRVLTEEARESGGRFIVPVEVRNLGRRSLKEIVIQFSHASAEGAKETGDLVIDHLGEGASHKAYLYLDRHPRESQVDVKAAGYQLE